MKKLIIYAKNKKFLEIYGKILSKLIFEKSVTFFIGELGIGKTTLIKSIAGFKIKYRIIIKSPSYKIIEKYKNNNILIYHIDFFKSKTIENLHFIDFFYYFKQKACFLIEWGDKFKINKLEPDIRIYIFSYSTTINRIILIKTSKLNIKKIFG